MLSSVNSKSSMKIQPLNHWGSFPLFFTYLALFFTFSTNVIHETSKSDQWIPKALCTTGHDVNTKINCVMFVLFLVFIEIDDGRGNWWNTWQRQDESKNEDLAKLCSYLHFNHKIHTHTLFIGFLQASSN